METQIKEGMKALNFTLFDTERKQRDLSEFVGDKLVLAFYPGAFTSVCTKEMCTLRDALSRLNELNARVVGVSVNDPFTNKAFAEKNALTYPLLSDYERKVVQAWGIALKDFAGLKGYTVAKRSVFIVDKSGLVQYRWVSEDPAQEPSYGEIEKKLKEMQ